MKKLINDPNRVAAEGLEGLALAFPHLVRKLDGLQAIVRAGSPVKGKVAVVVGGGSGHEPMFAGYVGAGMAHAAVMGNVFTSPPPIPVYETARAVEGGKGVLFVYGNYSGDVLNFDAAAEMLSEDEIEVDSVQVTDDVASAPQSEPSRRRGIAGGMLVFKIAGACAEEGSSLAEVAAAARLANNHTRTMGVALSSCTIPASGKKIFEIGDAEMEVGMGIHGEPGIHRAPIKQVDPIVQDLMQQLSEDLSLVSGDEVAVLINGLGATPVLELFLVSRAVSQCLSAMHVNAVRTFVGNYATSLDMAGCSITLMKLTPSLKQWLLAPAESPALSMVVQ